MYAAVILLLAVPLLFTITADAAEPDGISSRYPGDAGIEADPDVILVEDFEDDLVQVGWMEAGGWFDFRLGQGMQLSDANPAAGSRCLQFDLKQGKQSSGAMMQLIEDHEELFFRYYRRFAEDWYWPDGYGPHDAFIGGGDYSGRPTDQDFEILIDFWQNGATVARLASVRPESFKDVQREWNAAALGRDGKPSVGGHPVPWNVAEPDSIVPGKWHCVEMQIRLSSAGEADGILRMWVNGKLVTDYADVPMRDVGKEYVKLNKVFIGPYFHPGSPKDQAHWVDQIVAARKYIGPIKSKNITK